jgi:hypothetical protein
MPSSSRENSVTTNEFYYLLLVLGAFGAFVIGVSAATIQYKAWLGRRATAARAGVALAKNQPVRVGDLADAA